MMVSSPKILLRFTCLMPFSSGGVPEVEVSLLLYRWLLLIHTHILSSPERDKVDGILFLLLYLILQEFGESS